MTYKSFGLVFLLLLAGPLLASTNGRGLSSLPLPAQTRILAAIGKDSRAYFVRSSRGNFVAFNVGQKLHVQFSAAGVAIRHDGRGIGISLQAFGHGDSLEPVSAATPEVKGNQVNYRHRSLSEWYVNGLAGLEQGFTVDRSPGASEGQPLTIALTLSGDFSASIDDSRQSLILSGAAGQSQLRYGGLFGYDADGKQLVTWLELKGKSLLIRVSDENARYPLVIDPLIELAQLTAANGTAGDDFGFAIAVCGHTIVVGASEFNSNTNGAAYIFVEGATGWANMTETAKLTASDGKAGALFGLSVACSTRAVVVGALGQPVHTHPRQGEAYVFVEPANGWVNATETARLTAPGGRSFDEFGSSVAMSADGKTIAVGAPTASAQQMLQGKDYIFEKPTGGWKSTSHAKILTASNAQGDDGLGSSTSITGSALTGYTLAVGAPGGNSRAGAVYVFVKPPTGWQTTSNFDAELTASDGTTGSALGFGVSIDGNTIAAGAYESNAAYVFVSPQSGWASGTETAKLTAPADVVGSYFGYSLSLRGNKLAVGSGNDPSESSVFVFLKPPSGWATTSKYNTRLISPDGYGFGFAVAVGGGVVAVGSIGGNSSKGTAYVFGR
jgi:hypothetical protein